MSIKCLCMLVDVLFVYLQILLKWGGQNMARALTCLEGKSDVVRRNSIHIVCNNKITRAGLKQHLVQDGYEIAGQSSWGDNLRDEIYENKSDIVIFVRSYCDDLSNGLDDRLNSGLNGKLSGGLNGKLNGGLCVYEKLIADVLSDNPLLKVIVLTSEIDEREFCVLLDIGVRGYHGMDSDTDEILRVVGEVSKGNFSHDVRLNKFLYTMARNVTHMTDYPVDKPLDEQFNLTHMEKETLCEAATSAGYQETADKLFISTSTVKVHLSNVYKKAGVATLHQAVFKLYGIIYEYKLNKGLFEKKNDKGQCGKGCSRGYGRRG